MQHDIAMGVDETTIAPDNIEVRAWTTCTCGWRKDRTFQVDPEVATIEFYKETGVDLMQAYANEHRITTTDPFEGLTLEDDSDDPRDWR